MKLKIKVIFFLMITLLWAEPEYFAIQIIDSETKRGVPLVKLSTVNDIVYYTDSQGFIAFYEPGLMSHEVFFLIESHGYEYKKDMFGYRGIRLKTTPGTKVCISIKRINVAERLYRITGQGIYRDSFLLKESIYLKQPVVNNNVVGQDTVMMTSYRNSSYWFWGDTNRISYPLGNFQVSGAISTNDSPEKGINLHYFSHNGFCKKMCPFVEKGIVWIEGLLVVADKSNNERLVAQYEHRESLDNVLERGLVVFNDSKKVFEKQKIFAKESLYPRGHPILAWVGKEKYFFFSHPHPKPFPNVRVKATWEDLQDPTTYESLIKKGNSFTWEKNQKPQEDEIYLRDVDNSKLLRMHAGSVCWNSYRKRWILIGQQVEGKNSYLGEIWYAEADSIVGPWAYARKIVTHNEYTFYNPKQHRVFDQKNGQLVYFEGTYVNTFTRNRVAATPRYNYNQIMYRLNLSDSRLFLPCPLYRVTNSQNLHFMEDIAESSMINSVAFFTLPKNRKIELAIAVYSHKNGEGLQLNTQGTGTLLFYALNILDRRFHSTNLYEYRNKITGKYYYDIVENLGDDWQRIRIVCRVWKNPVQENLFDHNIRY